VTARARGRAAIAALLALIALAGPAATVATAASCPRTTLGDLEDEVMCPRCGRPLNTVDREPQAQRERAFMQTMIDRCRSKEQIKAALSAQFGPDVLAVPANKGFDTTAFIAPVLVPLAAFGLIVLTATRWRRRRPPGAAAAAASTTPAGPAIDEQDAARLDEDLERYKL
jgi:cytochrome c-type biogenesis protein CcmH